MKKSFLLSLLIALFGGACPLVGFSIGMPLEKTITITNSSEKAAYFFYFDKFNDLITVTVPVESTQEIKADLPLILYSANQERTAYLLYYQDSLELAFEKGKHFFNSKNRQSAEIASLLMALDDNLTKVVGTSSGSDTRAYEKLLAVPPARDSLLLKAYNIDREYLDAYFLQRKQDPNLVNYVKRYLHYNYLMERCKNLTVRAVVYNQVSADYKRSLLRLSEALTCDSCLEIYPYRKLAYYYLQYISENVSLDSQITYIDKSFLGKTKNFMLFTLFHNYASSNPKFFKANINSFLQIVEDPDYRKYVNNLKQDEHEGMLAKELEIYNVDGKAFLFADLIKRNSGKLIYIDFWASWCSPCIDEFPSSFSLAKKYVKKEITFLYFSLDKNRNLWESAMKRLGISQKDSFLIPLAFSSKLASRFKISSIPRYILIGKDGKVIHSDELRPSDPKLLKKLDQLL